MNLIFLSFILIFSFFPGCTSNDLLKSEKELTSQEEIKESQVLPAVDLNDSTEIIIELLKKNDLGSILVPEDSDSENSIDTLIKNFSPAQMAFESEVLNFTEPVIILYYDATNTDNQNIMSSFLETALNHHEEAKFVFIEISKLFSLAEQADITTAPTILLIDNRSELGRLENPDPSLLETEIIKLLEKIN